MHLYKLVDDRMNSFKFAFLQIKNQTQFKTIENNSKFSIHINSFNRSLSLQDEKAKVCKHNHTTMSMINFVIITTVLLIYCTHFIFTLLDNINF